MKRLLYLLIIFSSCGAHETTKDDLKNYAYVISENYVKDYLKSPSSAEFDAFSATPSIQVLNNNYTVAYHFTAKNSFGAKTTSTYICALVYNGGAPEHKDNWTLKGLQINDKLLTGSFGVAETNITASTNNNALQKYYSIEKSAGNGTYVKLFVYVKDTKLIEDVNAEILENYKGKWQQSIDIWYFDNKEIAGKYENIVNDGNVSDKEFKKADKHLLCTYTQDNLSKQGTFEYNN